MAYASAYIYAQLLLIVNCGITLGIFGSFILVIGKNRFYQAARPVKSIINPWSPVLLTGDDGKRRMCVSADVPTGKSRMSMWRTSAFYPSY